MATLRRPLVIAHRGASGYLPEHTLAAKALAFAQGADYLEQDLVVSRDDELIVVHDIHLDRISDVAVRYPGRSRPDGRFYVRDFTLAELRTLRATERVNEAGSAVYPERFPPAVGSFELHTLDEELAFVAGLARSTGRVVGIYPELKRPAWHREQGVDIGKLLFGKLTEFGYRRRDDPVYVQCFDFAELERWRHDFDSELKLVQLIGDNAWQESPTDFDWALSEPGLAEIGKIADALGPWIPTLIDPKTSRPAAWVDSAHRRGLALHPFTVRADDLIVGFDRLRALLEWLVFDARVDGFFTDFPDIAVDFLDESVFSGRA
ncbi:MAG: glycerophosphodiester phosphodiesterase [Pseudomonadota bacterium]